jgi:hypothetical protein
MTTADTTLPDCITRDRLTSPYWPNLSFAGLAAVVALGLLFMVTSFHRLNYTDLWGHLNFGRWMAMHHALPTNDPFAAQPSAIPVLNAAWLSQSLGYEVQRFFGNEGLVFGHALLVMLTAGLVMVAAYRRGAPAIWAWSAGVAMIVLDLPIVGTIRPQLFGQLGAALFLLACAEMPRRTHPLLWLPLVAALWSNLHGSIVMGLAILGLYAIGVTWNIYHEMAGVIGRVIRDRRLHIVWGAIALVMAAACLNPHGPSLLVRVLGFGDQAVLASISEWRSLTPRSLTGVLMIASVAATVALAKYSPRKWEAYEILLLAVFGLATLPAIRMLAWWAVVWPWVVWPHAAAAWRKYHADKTGEIITDLDEPTAMRTVLAMGFVFMTILIAPPAFSVVSGHARGEGPILVTDTPLYAADEVVRRGLVGNIAAPMDWADFIVWKTNGQVKPLVYTHVHLADMNTWRDYQTIFSGDAAWLERLRSQHMQYVLVPRKQYPTLSKNVLVEDRSGKGNVRILYQDQRCILAEVLPEPPKAENEDLFEPPSVPSN